MKKAEIEFCQRWVAQRGSDGCVQWAPEGGHPHPLRGVGAEIKGCVYIASHRLLDLTPRGADLVASYEAALTQGLEIRPDDGELAVEREAASHADDRTTETVVCDCEDGFTGIPIEYGPPGRVLRVWPAKCPKCDVERGRGGVDLEWETAKPQRVDGDRETGTCPWRPLTRDNADGLVGREFEAKLDWQSLVHRRRGLDVRSGRLRAKWVKESGDVTVDSWSLCGIWMVRILASDGDGWVTEPDVMRELLKSGVGDTFDLRGQPGRGYPLPKRARVAAETIDSTGRVRLYSEFWVWCDIGERRSASEYPPIITAVRRVD